MNKKKQLKILNKQKGFVHGISGFDDECVFDQFLWYFTYTAKTSSSCGQIVRVSESMRRIW